MHDPSVCVCLPARWGASRLPGKLALPSGGWSSVLARTAATARAAALGPVHVLADDARLVALVEPADGVTLHRVDAPARNGSERVAVALAAGLLGSPDIVLNLQADAVGAAPELLTAARDALARDVEASLATVAVPVAREELGGRTSVAAAGGRALYFSRHALPADRDGRGGRVLGHVGIYAYRPAALLRLAALPPGPLEDAESLEQLRWLERGERVAVAVVEGPARWLDAVDTPNDLGR